MEVKVGCKYVGFKPGCRHNHQDKVLLGHELCMSEQRDHYKLEAKYYTWCCHNNNLAAKP